MLGKRKSLEETPPAANRKNGKKMCIKTEMGEMLSITQNDLDSDDSEDTDSHPPAPLSKRLTNGQKENASPGENTDDEQTLSASAEGPSHVSNRVKNASSKRGRPTGQALLKVIAAVAENASHVQSSSASKSRGKRKQKKEGTVMAVIDLTSDSEFGELVDIKPDLEGLHNSVVENIQQEEDIKPDKDALDEHLGQKDDSNMPSASEPALADTKQEMEETSLQEPPAASLTTASEGEPIHFQPTTNGSTEFSVSMSEDGEDTAISLVQARLGQNMHKSERTHLVSQNGLSKMAVDAQGEDGDGKECDAENAGDSDFDGRVDDDDSDYRAYSTVDEKGDSSESHIDRRHCAVTEKSRSNSTEDASGGYNQGLSDDGDSVGKQDPNGRSHLEVSHEIDGSLAEEPTSVDCHENSRDEYESETREENDSPDVARDKDNAEADSPANLLEGNSFSKISPNLEDSVSPKTSSTFENINNSAVAHEDSEPSEHNTDEDNNELVGDSVQTVCTKQLLKSDVQQSLKPSGINGENSVDVGTNVSKCENQAAKPSLNQVDMTFLGKNKDTESLHHSSSSSLSFHDMCASMSHLQNLSSPDTPDTATTECSVHRTHDVMMQTDLDMLALGEMLELYTTAGGVCNFNHQVSHLKDKHLSGVETADKSLQTVFLEHNVSIAESQTEDTEWMRDSDDQAEVVEDLQTKLSLRSQQLEDTEKKLIEINVNIHKLLGYIVPGTELGDVNNIDQIIKDMIRIHEESFQETQFQESTKEIQTQNDTSIS